MYQLKRKTAIIRNILCPCLIFLVAACLPSKEKRTDFKTVFEISNGTETATYEQCIQFYRDLAYTYPEISIDSIGTTDSGKALHMVIFNPDLEFEFTKIRAKKRSLLINNGIHPGESDGIDASMMLFRDLAQGHIEQPKNTVLVSIPIYNIGGSLNRNSGTRTNQNGPISYGFRGNARNYDLNRDFIKSDTENAKSFAQIYHLVQPDVFIDNHVSNGADYQYILTHLFTQHNKLGNALGQFLNAEIQPALEKKLAAKEWDITPYVNVFNTLPENGFSQFMDSPRYSTGYTTLFNTFGMMVETHMLKPYKQRVLGTYELMKSMIEITEEQGEQIRNLRDDAVKTLIEKEYYPLNWTIDSSKSSSIVFKGVQGEMIPSDFTGSPRLKFDKSKPFSKDVTYQNYFKSADSVKIPKAYIIPQGWHNIINLLKLNQIEMTVLPSDSIMRVTQYKIEDFESRKSPYEGHYLHYNTQLSSEELEASFRAGDFLVPTEQSGIRYLLEALEPQAPDSFFNWNFFDTILQQKEHFSPYVWEDKAKALLEANPKLKAEFEARKQNDETFAKNWYAQLDWLHKQSTHYEKAHLRYPIFRIN